MKDLKSFQALEEIRNDGNFDKKNYGTWAVDVIVKILEQEYSLKEIIEKDLTKQILQNETTALEQKIRCLQKVFNLLCERYNLTPLLWNKCIIENIPYDAYDTSKIHPCLSHALQGIYPYSILPNSNKNFIDYLKEHPSIDTEIRKFISNHKKNKGRTPNIKTQFRLINDLIRVARELQIKSFAELNGHEGYIRLLNLFKKHNYQNRTSAVVSAMCFFGEMSNYLKITNPAESQKKDDTRQSSKKRASAFMELSEDSYYRKTKKINDQTFTVINGVTHGKFFMPDEINKITSLLPTSTEKWEKLDTPALQEIYTYSLNIICLIWSIFTWDRPAELSSHVRANLESSFTFTDSEGVLRNDSFIRNNYASSDTKKRTDKLFPIILSFEVRKLIRIQDILAQRLNVSLQPIKKDDWINSGIPIFLDEKLKYIDETEITRRMRKTLSLIGLDYISPYASLYWARKGGISLVANNTTSLKWISEITGTSTATLAKYYVYALKDAQEKYLDFLKKTNYLSFDTTVPEPTDEEKRSREFERCYRMGFANALTLIKEKTKIDLPITELLYKHQLEQSKNNEQFFTTEELIKLFNLSKNTIKLYRDKKIIKYKKEGNKYFYEKRSTLNFKKHVSSYEAANIFNMSRRYFQTLINKGIFKENIQPNRNQLISLEELMKYFITTKLGWKIAKDTLKITIEIAD